MFTRRFIQLQFGLILYGFSLALMVRAGLGLTPWDVFHQGLADWSGWSLGMVVNLVGGMVLLLWIPLRQRPGIGTIFNIIVIGATVDMALALMAAPDGLPLRLLLLLAGIFLNGVACAAYIGAGLGPGPRDGLMTGLVLRTGYSVRLVRASIELAVLGTGWLLGGTAGLGTILYAAAIGHIVQVTLPFFALPDRKADLPVPAE